LTPKIGVPLTPPRCLDLFPGSSFFPMGFFYFPDFRASVIAIQNPLKGRLVEVLAPLFQDSLFDSFPGASSKACRKNLPLTPAIGVSNMCCCSDTGFFCTPSPPAPHFTFGLRRSRLLFEIWNAPTPCKKARTKGLRKRRSQPPILDRAVPPLNKELKKKPQTKLPPTFFLGLQRRGRKRL